MRLIFAIILIAVTILIVAPNGNAQDMQTDLSSYSPNSKAEFIDDQANHDPAKVKALIEELLPEKDSTPKTETSNSLR